MAFGLRRGEICDLGGVDPASGRLTRQVIRLQEHGCGRSRGPWDSRCSTRKIPVA